MLRLIKKYYIVILSVIAAVIIVIESLFWYAGKVNTLFSSDTKSFLQSNANALANTFAVKLEDQLRILESQVQFFKSIDLYDYNEVKDTIMLTNDTGSFKDIYVVNSKGISLDWHGMVGPYVGGTDFFKAAKGGNSFVSMQTHTDFDGENIICVSVPIIQGNSVKGLVYGTFSEDILGELLGSGFDNVHSASALFSRDGNVLAMGSGLSSFPEFSRPDFFTKITVTDFDTGAVVDNPQERLWNIDSGAFYIDSEFGRRIAILSGIENSEWLYVLVVPTTSIDRSTDTMTKYLGIVEMCLLLSCAFVMVSIGVLIRKNSLVERTNERYARVSLKSQTLFFEYNYIKRKMEFGGDLSAFGKDIKNHVNGNDIQSVMFSKVHPDDISALKDLKEVRNNDVELIECEARVMCADDEYKWFRLRAEVTRNADGDPISIEGNIVNSEERVKEELMLKHKAETDPLTGLLNKGASESYVTEALKGAGNDELMALFIIDLDNFKNVNDTLGHAIGDKVLSDVAMKMGSVFYENDLLGRIGGDEFMAFVKLSSEGKRNGMRLIESKATALCRKLDDVYSNGKAEVHISASVGVAMFPYDGSIYEELYRKADAALYAAKNSGKNQSHIYNGGGMR